MDNSIVANEDTIDLRELFGTLKRRKKLIVLITLASLILATTYIMLTKPIYQVQAMIEIGKIDKELLDNAQNIKQKLDYIYGVKSKKKMKLPRVKAIFIDKKTKGIFSVTIEGHSNNEAVNLTNEIVQKIEKEHAEYRDTYINTKKEFISLVNIDIARNEKNLKEVQETLNNYNQKVINIAEEDAALAGIYAIQISKNQAQIQSYQNQISALKTKKHNLELSISPLKIRKTSIIGDVEVLDKPIKPKKALILIVALITGLLFSIFLVFFLAFLERIKEEELKQT